MISDDASALIKQLDLTRHPEGGWYRETWRAPSLGGHPTDSRAAGTAILFLLQAGERSHWHRVDAAEMWLWHRGDPLRLEIAAADEGPVTAHTLSSQLEDGHHVQKLVRAGEWQAASAIEGGAHGYSLVSCVVVPGFTFDGFELAPPGWFPGKDH